MKISHLAFFAMGIAGAYFPMSAFSEAPTSPPVSATFISKHVAKPPQENIGTTVTITNPTSVPLWYVFPYELDQQPTLSHTVRLTQGLETPGGIEGEGYNTGFYRERKSENKGKAIRVVVLEPANDKSFCLFRLPPRGQIKFEDYVFQAFSDKYHRSFKMWVADRIIVNGNELLEKWLPYQTLSDPEVFISKGTMQDNLDFDVKTFKTRTDYKKEPVRRLDLNITGSWVVPIEGLK